MIARVARADGSPARQRPMSMAANAAAMCAPAAVSVRGLEP
jgi:hypothetical protein